MIGNDDELEKLLPALVSVNDRLPSKTKDPFGSIGTLATRVREPYIVLAVGPESKSGVPVQPVKSMDLPSLGMSGLIVCEAENALGMFTLSCGNGTREVQPCVDQTKVEVPVAV